MAGVSEVIRQWLDLLEAIQQVWGIDHGRLFESSVKEMMARVPDLPERLARFIAIKKPNPLSRDAMFGKHDTPFTLMPGYRHCHLAPDAILIYRLANHCIQLVLICQHADIQGKRIRALGKLIGAI